MPDVQIGLRFRDQITSGFQRAARAARSFQQAATRGFQRASRALKGFTRAITNIRNIIGGFILVKAIQGIGRFATGIAELGNNIDDLSNRLGVSTEFLSQMRFASEETGVDFNTLSLAVQRAQRRFAEFRDRGAGPAADALRLLGGGLSEAVMQGETFENLLPRISDRMAGLGDANTRLLVAFKLFDSEGAKLVQTIGSGSAAIDELRQKADELGLTFTKLEAETATKFIAATVDFRAAVDGLRKAIVIQMLPALTTGITRLTELISGNREKIVEFFHGAALASLEFGKDVVRVIQEVRDAIKGLFDDLAGVEAKAGRGLALLNQARQANNLDPIAPGERRGGLIQQVQRFVQGGVATGARDAELERQLGVAIEGLQARQTEQQKDPLDAVISRFSEMQRALIDQRKRFLAAQRGESQETVDVFEREAQRYLKMQDRIEDIDEKIAALAEKSEKTAKTLSERFSQASGVVKGAMTAAFDAGAAAMDRVFGAEWKAPPPSYLEQLKSVAQHFLNIQEEAKAAEEATAEAALKMRQQAEETQPLAGLGAAFRKMGQEAKKLGETVQEVTDLAVRDFAFGLANAFGDFSSGAKKAKDAFTDFAQSFLKQTTVMIAQAILLKAIQAGLGFFGFGSGGGGGSSGGGGGGNTAAAAAPQAKGGVLAGPTFPTFQRTASFAKGGIKKATAPSRREASFPLFGTPRVLSFAKGGLMGSPEEHEPGPFSSFRRVARAFAKGGMVGGVEAEKRDPTFPVFRFGRRMLTFAKGGLAQSSEGSAPTFPVFSKMRLAQAAARAFAKGGVIEGGTRGPAFRSFDLVAAKPRELAKGGTIARAWELDVADRLGQIPKALEFATGGILKKFQSGGVLTTRTFAQTAEGPALMREAFQNEAVVPLPDNRSIPVKFVGSQGGGGGTTINENVAPQITFQIATLDAASFSQKLAENKSQVVGIVSEAVRRRTDFHNLMGAR